MSKEDSQWRLPKTSSVEVKRKGGALYVLIPSEIAAFLQVEEGDKVSYIKDTKNKTVLMLNPSRLKVMIEGLGSAEIGFSVPKRLLKKVLSKSG
jgi:antitoxin component of MazEF toxin-antitoxin module